jgi:membrane protease YdiL (CAAX protease family)
VHSPQRNAATIDELHDRPLLAYVVLVFALAIPFWLFAAWTGAQLFPGLPVSALMVVCPLIAASLLVFRSSGIAGVQALLRRAADVRRIAPIWYLPIVLLMPAVAIVSYGVMQVLGMPLPAPHVSLLTAVVLFLAFFVAAVGEETGWSGYATDPMLARWGALQVSILLGIVWAVWHFIPLMQAGRSPGWIAGWCVSTVAFRVLLVWLYSNTGSVFATILTHAMGNLSMFLFPNDGSHYDPRVAGPLLAVVAAIVTVIWGPRTLARFRAPH